MKNEKVKRIFWGVVVGLLIIGTLGYAHWQLHRLTAPRTRSQTQVQERKTEQIETITQKVIFVD